MLSELLSKARVTRCVWAAAHHLCSDRFIYAAVNARCVSSGLTNFSMILRKGQLAQACSVDPHAGSMLWLAWSMMRLKVSMSGEGPKDAPIAVRGMGALRGSRSALSPFFGQCGEDWADRQSQGVLLSRSALLLPHCLWWPS